MAIVPTKFFLTKGTGVHEKDMRAFEEALRDAGVHTCNLLKHPALSRQVVNGFQNKKVSNS